MGIFFMYDLTDINIIYNPFKKYIQLQSHFKNFDLFDLFIE